MKYYIMAVLLLISGLSMAFEVEKCETLDSKISVKINNIRSLPVVSDPDPDFNHSILSQTYALPYQQAHLTINRMVWKEFDHEGNFLRTTSALDNNAAYLAKSFTFREMYGFTVNMQQQIEDKNTVKVLQEIDFELTGSVPAELPQSVSPTFTKAYQKLAANYDTSYLRNLPLARPKLLIISHTSLTGYLANFIAWKKSKGFDVYVENVQNIGSTPVVIRDFILAHYLQYQCDHLLILGDVTGTYAIPTNIYPSPPTAPPENDADDNFYTMLLGDDYFPEMISGRFSFGDISELLTMTNKTIAYEKTPYMANTNWMHRSLVVAGNYAEGGLRPVTPVWMSRWLREKMLSKGYAQVDTVFYPPTLTGVSAITASINQGVQYISYRGWGAADGWHYPSFHNVDLNSSLVNGARMPIVFSIVCNTGDFANVQQNPCFGEKWMRMGTVQSPGGIVGFVGPSDLYTKTNLNNTISSGMFSSIFDDGERNIGVAVLVGRIELYKSY
ncbi:MAG: C25 family cysteine peptidase, partial [Candidatus Cloacimonadaceae bacterium]